MDLTDYLKEPKSLFLKSITRPALWRRQLVMFLGFTDGLISFRDFLILLMPVKLVPSKMKVLPRYYEFLEQRSKLELARYVSQDGSVKLFGRPFKASYHAILALAESVIFEDQYHAKQALRDDSVIIDAGANVGIFSVFANSIAQRGHVYAFEPVKSTFSVLQKNASNYPAITCVHAGLGNSVAVKNVLDMGYANNGMLSGTSVIEDSSLYDSSGAERAINSMMGNLEPAQITTIDAFVSDNDIPRVDFIKIDTEGYESRILSGASATINKYRPRIAMSAYHNREDVDELPRLLKGIYPDYTCELHQDNEEDLICYVKPA